MSLRAIRISIAALIAGEITILVLGPLAADHLPAIAEAIAAGRRPDWRHDSAVGIRLAAWINAGLLLALALSATSWARPLPFSHLPSPISHLPCPRWFWPALIGAAALCLALRLPLASKSLWWDEAWVIKEASHGKWTPDKKHQETLRFMAHDWKRCAWYYQKPTNHAPMSLMQKASLGAWRSLTGAKRHEFSELPARAPALLASATAVVLLGCLLRTWGRPGAGVAAAFVLAIHPWHVRYGVEARAYALVVPLSIAGMLALSRIVSSGGTRLLPWIAWAMIEFVWLWAFPNALIDIAALNLAAAILLSRRHPQRADRWTALLRLGVANLAAAACFLHAFLPNLMQARRWAGQETDRHLLDYTLAGRTFAQLLYGALDPAAGPLPAAHIAAGLAILSASCGVVHWRRRQVPHPFILAPTILASSLLLALATLVLASYFYPRFAIAALPAAIAVVCLAISLARRPWPAVVAAVSFLAFAAMPLKEFLRLPIAPLRDAAEFARADSMVAGGRLPLVACYGLGREVIPVYDRWCVPVESGAVLESLLQEARSARRPLYVIQGYDTFNRQMLPGGFALLDDRGRFEHLREFEGIEPDFRFHVFRAR